MYTQMPCHVAYQSLLKAMLQRLKVIVDCNCMLLRASYQADLCLTAPALHKETLDLFKSSSKCLLWAAAWEASEEVMYANRPFLLSALPVFRMCWFFFLPLFFSFPIWMKKECQSFGEGNGTPVPKLWWKVGSLQSGNLKHPEERWRPLRFSARNGSRRFYPCQQAFLF